MYIFKIDTTPVDSHCATLSQINITLDITDLDIGGSIKVSSLTSDGIEFLDSKNIELVAVKMARGVEETPAEEGKK